MKLLWLLAHQKPAPSLWSAGNTCLGSGFPPQARVVLQALKTYGLIVADNGTDMYVSGTYDTRWNNDLLNPAFGAIKASDFEVVQLGWQPPARSRRRGVRH